MFNVRKSDQWRGLHTMHVVIFAINCTTYPSTSCKWASYESGHFGWGSTIKYDDIYGTVHQAREAGMLMGYKDRRANLADIVRHYLRERLRRP